LFIGLEDKKYRRLARLASRIGLLGVFCGFCDQWGCRGDTLDGHFSGRVGDEAKKSDFGGNISHQSVAATLFKIGKCEIMRS
jgi:hypothetical protein